MLEQLLVGFVHADLGLHWVVGAVIDVENILHRPHELRVFPRWDAESLHLPWLDLVFFRPRWTVLLLTLSKTSSSTSPLAIWWLAARQPHQLGLCRTVEFAGARRFVLRFAFKARLDPALAASLSHTLDRQEPHFQLVSDLLESTY